MGSNEPYFWQAADMKKKSHLALIGNGNCAKNVFLGHMVLSSMNNIMSSSRPLIFVFLGPEICN